MYKFIFIICFFLITSSSNESSYHIADEININTSNQLIFDLQTEFDEDSEPSTPEDVTNNNVHQLTYLSKLFTFERFTIFKNKYQYLRPRAPPRFI